MKYRALLLLVLSVTLPGTARQKAAKTYPEHGIIVAIRARTLSRGMILGPGQGPTIVISRGSYRIETKDRFYEFEERRRKPTLALNEAIDFRVEKGSAYVRESNGKEKKYRIIGEESKSSKNPRH